MTWQLYVSPQARSRPSLARGEASDEVRIMRKVLTSLPDLSAGECVSALDATDWNVHHAIKLVKLRVLAAGRVGDAVMIEALRTRDWEVAKAAKVVEQKIRE